MTIGKSLRDNVPNYNCSVVLSCISRRMIQIPEGPLLAFLFLMVLTIICIINFEVNAEPMINDPSLQVESVITGIKFPSSMAFLGSADILVLEKNEGTVRRIVNGNMLNESLLDVNVANKKETGMLGIAISKKESKDGDKPKDLYQINSNL